MHLPLTAEPAHPTTTEIVGWALTLLGIIATVLGIFATIFVAYYATKVRPRFKVNATCDPTNIVKVAVFNGGKEVMEVYRVDFIARAWWAARLLRRLAFRKAWEPVISSVIAEPKDMQLITPGTAKTWHISVPGSLDYWPLPPSLLHPLSSTRRGKVSTWRLAVRVGRGAHHRCQYRWFERRLRIRRIQRVSNEFG